MRPNLIGFTVGSIVNAPLMYLSLSQMFKEEKGSFLLERSGSIGCVLTFGICFIMSTRFSYNVTRHFTTRILHNIVSK